MSKKFAEISRSYRREAESRTYIFLNIVWLLLALVVLFSGFVEIQNAARLDVGQPNAVKDAFVPLMTFGGYERLVFRVDGLRSQLVLFLLLALKNLFIFARNTLSFAGNYMLLIAFVLFSIYYIKWSAELISCRDCVYFVSPFFPSAPWPGTVFLLFSILMVLAEVVYLSVLVFRKKVENQTFSGA